MNCTGLSAVKREISHRIIARLARPFSSLSLCLSFFRRMRGRQRENRESRSFNVAPLLGAASYIPPNVGVSIVRIQRLQNNVCTFWMDVPNNIWRSCSEQRRQTMKWLNLLPSLASLPPLFCETACVMPDTGEG